MIWALMFFIFFSSWFMPWWFYLLISVFIGWHSKSLSAGFVTGFLGTGLVWVMAAYYQDLRSESIISRRLSEMFALPHALLIYLVLFLVAGVSSGLCCMLGRTLSDFTLYKKRQNADA